MSASGGKVKTSLTVLVLSEDSSKQAPHALANLLRKIFLILDEQTQTHEPKLVFRPLDKGEDAALRALNKNGWRGSSSSPGRNQDAVRLIQTIATKLREPNTVVIFHYDGDCAWADRDFCDTAKKFETLIRNRVRQLMNTPSAQRVPRSERKAPIPAAEIDGSMSNLLEVVPFYSVESWMYQSADAIDACREGCGEHAALFDEWHADRAKLDEVHQPKDEICFGNQQNERLSKTVPIVAVAQTGKSLHLAVERMRECKTLMAGLAATHAA